MPNPFVLFCQPFLSRILRSDRLNLSNSIPLPEPKLYRERGSSDLMVVAPQKLALGSLHPLRLLHKQTSTLAQHNVSAANLPHKESLKIRVLSTVSCLAGLTVILAGCSSNSVSSDSPTSSSPVSSLGAKDINDQDISNYASAVLAIEPKRRAADKDIQALSNDEKIPDITCTKEDTIKAVEQSIQDIAVKYCKQAKQLVKNQNLTISKFNDITAKAASNPGLQTQIQNELLRLQK